MNIMKNAVKMRYQNSPGMWRKHTPSALDKWYDKLESDCDIQFVVFFVLLTYLLQNWYSLTHLWRVPSHMPGWWRPVLFYPRLKEWEKESIIKWQIEKKREKENINIIYWGEEKMPKVECTIILRNQPWQALTRNCRDDFVAANFMLSGIFFLINSSAFTNMRAVGVCLCNITVSHYRLILFLDRKFYTCWSLIWSHFLNMMYKYIFI